jgi:hypothetical protein
LCGIQFAQFWIIAFEIEGRHKVRHDPVEDSVPEAERRSQRRSNLPPIRLAPGKLM